MTSPVATDRLAALIDARERASNALLASEGDRIARICCDLARAFSRGGVLVADGCGSARVDAERIAAGFLRPETGADHARPALGPVTYPAGAARIACLGRPDDVALAIAHGPADESVHAFLDEAGRRGSLRVAFLGPGGHAPQADHVLVVDCDDPRIVQELQQTLGHVLPELVELFLAEPSLLEEACITCGDVAVAGRVVAVEGYGAVIECDGGREHVAIDLVEDVVVGTLLLCHAGVALERLPDDAPAPAEETAGRSLAATHGAAGVDAVFARVRDTLTQWAAAADAVRRGIHITAIQSCAEAMRTRLEAGGRLVVFGDERSASAVDDVVADALESGWPAIALAGRTADEAFNEAALATLGRHGDIALAIAADDLPDGVVAALAQAHRRGMMTCVIAGPKAAGLARVDWSDELFVVDGHGTSCVQEGHTAIYHLLLDVIGGRT